MPPPERAMSCNCSMCKPMGWRLAFAPGSQFTLLKGEDALVDYQFAKEHIHHRFCGTCGIRSFSHGPDAEGNPFYSINLNCVDGIDASKLEIDWYDGAAL